MKKPGVSTIMILVFLPKAYCALTLKDAAFVAKKVVETGAKTVLLMEKDAEDDALKESFEKKRIEIIPEDIAGDIAANMDFEEENPEGLNQVNLLFGVDSVILAECGESSTKIKIISCKTGKIVFERIYRKAQTKQEEAKEKPAKKALKEKKKKTRKSGEKKNSLGFLVGPALYNSEFKDFKTLKDNNAGAKYYANTLNINAELFYERKISENYSFILSFGQKKMNDEEYIQPGKGINLKAKSKYMDFSLLRKISKKFSIYAGAGADEMEFTLTDPAPLAGISVDHDEFGGTKLTCHFQAGITYSPRHFTLKLGARQIVSPDAKFSGNISGGDYPPGKYDVIMRNNSAIDFKRSDSVLAANERYIKPTLGGMETFVMIGYKFSFY